jgi:hypothetical protein
VASKIFLGTLEACGTGKGQADRKEKDPLPCDIRPSQRMRIVEREVVVTGGILPERPIEEEVPSAFSRHCRNASLRRLLKQLTLHIVLWKDVKRFDTTFARQNLRNAASALCRDQTSASNGPGTDGFGATAPAQSGTSRTGFCGLSVRRRALRSPFANCECRLLSLRCQPEVSTT